MEGEKIEQKTFGEMGVWIDDDGCRDQFGQWVDNKIF
jgi:hypothetical protein